MEKKPFAPKDAATLKSEIIAELGSDYEGDEKLIDKMVARELKSEQLKASLHEGKTKYKTKFLSVAEKAGFDPETGEPIKKKETEAKAPETKDQEARFRQLLAEERFLAEGHSNTELRKLKVIMAATGKDFKEAQKDSLFVGFMEKQAREQKSRLAQLPPSRGGSFAPKSEETEIEKKFDDNLPPGFSAKPKK